MTTSHASTRSTVPASPSASLFAASPIATPRSRYGGSSVAMLVALLALGGCARSVEPSVEVPPDVVPGTSSLLESCLLGGGEFTLRHEVNNNDTSPHGDVVSFTVSGERLAVGSADGTIKLWTLDGFVATLASGALTYGPELATTEPRDLTFLGEEIVSGDARGLVTAFQTSGELRVLGGTTPDYSIVAVAIGPAVGTGSVRLAHADTSVGGNVLIREVDGDAVVGPLATGLELITDLHFLTDGTLLAAGEGGPSGSLARYDATGARIAASDDTDAIGEFDAAGGVVAAITPSSLDLYDEDLVRRARIVDGVTSPRSVALSTRGRVAFAIVDYGSSVERWDSVTLVAFDTATGAVLAGIDAPAALRIDTTPEADVAFVAARDGWVRAYGCRALTP